MNEPIPSKLLCLPMGLSLLLFTWISASAGETSGSGTNETPSADVIVDEGFGTEAEVWSLAMQPDGKILSGGILYHVDGKQAFGPGRFNADGTPDASFFPRVFGTVFSLAVQRDGKILVGGDLNPGLYFGLHVSRLNPDGSRDTGFAAYINSGFDSNVDTLVIQPDGKILVGGIFTALNGQPLSSLGRLNPDGSLDVTFNPDIRGIEPVNVVCLALQPNGQILVGGRFSQLDDQLHANLGRLNPDGRVDPTFTTTANEIVTTLVLQADGKILVAGKFTQLSDQPRAGIGRLHADGSLDGGFHPEISGGEPPISECIVADERGVWSLGLRADGKILVVGRFTELESEPRNFLGRLNSDGSLDTTFDAPVSGHDFPSYFFEQPPACDLIVPKVSGLAIQPDGKIVLGGWFDSVAGQSRTNLARFGSANNDAAQSLQVNACGTRVTWARSGAGPEVEQVTFEQSSDGIDYAPLGEGIRIQGGWELTGLRLPLNQTFHVRASGRAVSGLFNHSSGLIEAVQSFHLADFAPTILGIFRTSADGTVRLEFLGRAGGTYALECSTDLVNWTSLTNLLAGPDCLFEYFESPTTAKPALFYRLHGSEEQSGVEIMEESPSTKLLDQR